MSQFSVIVATLGRTSELKRLLSSLREQAEAIQLVIVDQNGDDRLVPIISDFKDKIQIDHIRLSPGLARARNAGLQVAVGEIVSFPDDDAWYPPSVLSQIGKRLRLMPEFDGICARCTDENGIDAGLRWLKHPAVIDRLNIWRTSTESTMFLRRSAISDLRFNEELGLGANTPWGAGEGTDFLLRALSRGHRLKYDPDVVVHHPSYLSNPPSEKKVLDYARGIGRVMRLNGYNPALAMMLCLGPLARAAMRLAHLDMLGAALARRVAFERLAGYRARL
jgi:glycosyltransferase involved in cell wall biosynthesis